MNNTIGKQGTCSLRALEPEDIDFLYNLENQESLWDVSQTQIPFSRYALQNYIQNAQQDIYEAKQFRYVIHHSEGRPIGCVDLYDFDPKNRRACVGIALLEEYRRKGIGNLALNILLDYGKNYFDLHQLVAYIPEDNIGSRRLFEKAGFVSYGVQKDWIFSRGKFKDVFVYQKII